MGLDLPLCSEDANDILKVIIKNEKLENPQVTFLQGSKVGEGYLGINKAVDVSDGNKTLHLFLKAAPKDEKLRESCHIRDAYSNEYHFYTVILPIKNEFLKKKTGKSLELISKFYVGSIAEKKEIFVFENLTSKGFALNNEKYVFGKERSHLVMREYGKLHGISFALKDQDTQTFNNITKDLPDLLALMYDSWKWESIIELCCKAIEKYLQSPADSVLLEKLEYISKNSRKIILKINEFQGEHRIILHGDSNFNNMMFRSQNNDLDLRLIDFQGVKINSPVIDLSYFLYCSASSKQNLDELDRFLTTYYDSLSSTIRELGSEPEKVCPFSIIKEHWKEFCLYGLIVSIIIIPSMVNDGDPYELKENNELSEADMSKEQFNNEEEYAKRIKCVLQHLVDNNFI